jgi:hypothetical protein
MLVAFPRHVSYDCSFIPSETPGVADAFSLYNFASGIKGSLVHHRYIYIYILW